MASLTPGQQQEMDHVLREVAIIKKRLDKKEIPARAVILRQDELTDLRILYGLPVIRVSADSVARWGVMA
jgi:hypothetical protein